MAGEVQALSDYPSVGDEEKTPLREVSLYNF